MKRPAFQFYPSDWRADMALQSCSIAARGLWHELLCVMHECTPYGHLAVNGVPMPEANAARATGVTVAEYRKALAELHKANVFSTTADGVLFSRRMVKDEHLRSVRAQAGRLGGNPNLVNQTHKQNSNQSPTPSSSSSSSEEPKELVASARSPKSAVSIHGTRLDPNWALPADWAEWALQERPDFVIADVERVALVFRDHWHSKPGQGARKADWFKTWCNWVRKEQRHYSKRPSDALSDRRERHARNMDILTGKVRDERTVEGIAERIDRPPLLAIAGGIREPDGLDVEGCRPPRGAAGVG